MGLGCGLSVGIGVAVCTGATVGSVVADGSGVVVAIGSGVAAPGTPASAVGVPGCAMFVAPAVPTGIGVLLGRGVNVGNEVFVGKGVSVGGIIVAVEASASPLPCVGAKIFRMPPGPPVPELPPLLTKPAA